MSNVFRYFWLLRILSINETMRIERLRLKNFRCFDELPLVFNPNFNVLIGDNATGKTSILDALSIGIGSYFLGVDQVYGKTILYKDIRKNTFSRSREYQLPCEIELTGTISGSDKKLIWQRSVLTAKGNTRRDKDTNELVKIAKAHQDAVRNDEPILLPVVNYYGTGRLWRDKVSNIKTIPKTSRFTGYVNALEPISNSDKFMEWMKTRTYTEIQRNSRDEALVLVQAVVGAFLQNNQRVVFDIEEDSIMLEALVGAQTNRLLWNELSDGYRNIIALAADLAYRCFTLNPHLGIYAASQSEGVVLIDEIDLHLHPSWQKTVVASFKKAFPKIQFIATTHSPFIVQSLKNEELIDIQGKNMDDDYRNISIEEIAEGEMGVEQAHRSIRFQEMKAVADQYFQLIREGKEVIDKEEVQRIKEKLEQLMIPFYDDPAYVAYLESHKFQLGNDAPNR